MYKRQGLNRSIGATISIAAAISVVLLVLSQVTMDPILRAMNTPEEVIGGAFTYLRIMFAGIPIIMAYNVLASILRALGDSRTPLYAMLIASVINIVLDLVFVKMCIRDSSLYKRRRAANCLQSLQKVYLHRRLCRISKRRRPKTARNSAMCICSFERPHRRPMQSPAFRKPRGHGFAAGKSRASFFIRTKYVATSRTAAPAHAATSA